MCQCEWLLRLSPDCLCIVCPYLCFCSTVQLSRSTSVASMLTLQATLGRAPANPYRAVVPYRQEGAVLGLSLVRSTPLAPTVAKPASEPHPLFNRTRKALLHAQTEHHQRPVLVLGTNVYLALAWLTGSMPSPRASRPTSTCASRHPSSRLHTTNTCVRYV